MTPDILFLIIIITLALLSFLLISYTNVSLFKKHFNLRIKDLPQRTVYPTYSNDQMKQIKEDLRIQMFADIYN